MFLSRDANLQSPIRYHEINGQKIILEAKHGFIFSHDLGDLLLAGKSVIFIVDCFLCVSHHAVMGYLLVFMSLGSTTTQTLAHTFKNSLAMTEGMGKRFR